MGEAEILCLGDETIKVQVSPLHVNEKRVEIFVLDKETYNSTLIPRTFKLESIHLYNLWDY